MRGGLWIYENRPTAPINCMFEGLLELREVDGCLDVKLTDVRIHDKSTDFGTIPRSELPPDVVHWTPGEDIVFQGLRVDRRTDRFVYTATPDQNTRVVIDYAPTIKV